MTVTHQNHQPAAVPPIVDRETWHGARDELLVREKAHMRAGDAIAAARRRLPMTEVDGSTTVVGPDGPRTLLDLFEGREELVVYRHMWFPGKPFENQCEGCPKTYWATQNLSAYLNARGVSFAVSRRGRTPSSRGSSSSWVTPGTGTPRRERTCRRKKLPAAGPNSLNSTARVSRLRGWPGTPCVRRLPGWLSQNGGSVVSQPGKTRGRVVPRMPASSARDNRVGAGPLP